MDIKEVKKLKKSEIKSALSYTKTFIIFGIIIGLLAIFFFTLGCQLKKDTIVNGLGNAYINAAQAEADYLMASHKANNDSLLTLGVLFKAAATMEQVHMKNLKNFYANYTGNVNGLAEFDTLKNIKRYNDGMSVVFLLDSTNHALAYFMGKQSYFVNSLFESLATEAETEKDIPLAKMYIWYMGSESSAYRLFNDAYQNFNQAYLFSDKYDVCPKCGSIYIYGDNIQYCTVCGEDAKKFILVQ
ncbi:MAG: hypothetical protein RSA75_09930 [Bacteroidales bacterium]